jgi:hypothetical protein
MTLTPANRPPWEGSMNERIDIYVRNVNTGRYEYSHGTRMYATLAEAQRRESNNWPSVAIKARWSERQA